ncbi:hypothetical protein [Mycoplasma bradburyae]|uniref:Lipoprotein n=2 Tax=Mycoplasma bradburyae TaxID=2963128 RepID=A0AAW6HNE3_9MOLU|nr:hypothetical protein [Mycoplasma bradburyae]MDC4183151.1 hypothetical protein [Mycoplasma bradburyae]
MKKKVLKSLIGVFWGGLLISATALSSCFNGKNDNSGSKKPEDGSNPIDKTNPVNDNVLSFKDQQITINPVTDQEVADVLATSSTPNEKVIKLFRDQAQVEMWKAALKEFKKSKSYEQGYRVRFIDKGVFEALESMKSITVDDPQIADIYYAPADQITSLADAAQAINLNEFKVYNMNIFDHLKKSFDLPSEKVKEMINFGIYLGRNGNNPAAEALALQHNSEGIFIVSPKTENEALTILKNDETNSLTELVNAGKALWHTQNFWFGLGVVGGVTQAETEKRINEATDEAVKKQLQNQALIEKLVYWGNNAASSGWLTTDPNHALFSKATDYNSGLLYKLYEAVYKLTDEQYKQTPWGKAGIQKNTLETAFNSDGGTYLNTIYQLFKEKKLDFGMVGTWELRNAITNGGVKSIFTVPNVVDGVKYLQSPGSWSWGIVRNKMNTSASEDRKLAIINMLLSIYSPNASYQYFLSDSKVPIFESVQKKIKVAIDQNSKINNKELTELATNLMYANSDELLAKYNELGKKILELKAWVGKDWEATVTDATMAKMPLDESYLNKKSLWEDKIKDSKLPESLVNRYKELIMDAAPLKNALAAIFSADNVKAIENEQAAWKLKNTFLKDNAVSENKPSETFVNSLPEDLRTVFKGLFDGNAIHFRKLENAILGYDGDGKDASILTNNQLATDLLTAPTGEKLDAAKAEVTKQINAAVDKATKLLNAIAKTMPNAETIKKAVTLMYYEFLNNALLYKLVDLSLLQSKMPKKDGMASDYTLSDVAKKVEASSNVSIVSKILDVITSDKSYAENGTGIFETLPKRPGVSNPQFGTVWGSWNEKTFGNLEFFKSKKDSVTNEEAFKKVVRDQLSASMTTALATIKDAQSFTINFGPSKQ